MKSINKFILEKLKISSKHNLPSIDAFCNRFLQYIHSKAKTTIKFWELPECKRYILGEDIYKETYNYLEHYEKN